MFFLMAHHSHKTLLGAVLVMLLLAQPAVEASVFDDAVNFVVNKALGVFASGTAQVQPSIFRVIDAVAAKRQARGDMQGATRIQELKQWFSFLGLHKGLPAIAGQLLTHRKALTDAWGLVSGTAKACQQRASQVGVVQALQEQSSDITRVTRVVVAKLKDALPTGPTQAFFRDLSVELHSDNLAADILEELLPQEQRQQIMQSLQQYLAMLRSTLEGNQRQSAPARAPASQPAPAPTADEL